MRYVVKKCDANNPLGVTVFSSESKDECIKGALLLAVMELVPSGEIWKEDDERELNSRLEKDEFRVVRLKDHIISWKGNYSKSVVFDVEQYDNN